MDSTTARPRGDRLVIGCWNLAPPVDRSAEQIERHATVALSRGDQACTGDRSRLMDR